MGKKAIRRALRMGLLPATLNRGCRMSPWWVAGFGLGLRGRRSRVLAQQSGRITRVVIQHGLPEVWSGRCLCRHAAVVVACQRAPIVLMTRASIVLITPKLRC